MTWVYSVHWRQEVVTVTISVDASTDVEARERGRRRLAVLFPVLVDKFTDDHVEPFAVAVARDQRGRR